MQGMYATVDGEVGGTYQFSLYPGFSFLIIFFPNHLVFFTHIFDPSGSIVIIKKSFQKIIIQIFL